MDRELQTSKFTNECNSSYLTTIRDFISENVVKVMADQRTSRGMFDALYKDEEWDADTDLTMGASGEHDTTISNNDSHTEYCEQRQLKQLSTISSK